ncbi:hypothetical protein Tco_1355133 [Tanacetum coccineum]
MYVSTQSCLLRMQTIDSSSVHFDWDDALERRAVELARRADVMLMLWNDGFSLLKIKPQKHLQCLRMILAQIELLTERALIHDAQNKGVQRNQQAFYYLEKAAYQLQPDALYLMGAIALTVECVKKDIASQSRNMSRIRSPMDRKIRTRPNSYHDASYIKVFHRVTGNVETKGQSSSVSHKQEAEEVSFQMRPFFSVETCHLNPLLQNLLAQNKFVEAEHENQEQSQLWVEETDITEVVKYEREKSQSEIYNDSNASQPPLAAFCHAIDEEIKLAYGRLAKYYHPDGLYFTYSHTNLILFMAFGCTILHLVFAILQSLAKEENAKVGRLLAGSKITSMLTADYMILCGAE